MSGGMDSAMAATRAIRLHHRLFVRLGLIMQAVVGTG
jgi:hypothetical protein